MGVPSKKNKHSEQELVNRIKRGDEAAFEKIFFDYYTDLCLFAFKIVQSKKSSEDVVQNVFLSLWGSRKKWQIDASLKAYLYRAVKNRAINYSKKQQNYRTTRETYLKSVDSYSYSVDTEMADRKSMVKQIWKIVQSMPDRRSLVFILHRKHGLTYKEIAGVLDISRKTVENHMGYALKQIREEINHQ